MANLQWQELAERIRGQERWDEQFAREVVDQWRASGLSGAAMAAELGINAQRLFWWRDRLGYGAGSGDTHALGTPTRFAAVVVREDVAHQTSSVPLTIELPDGICVRVHEADSTTAAWVALFTSSLCEVHR